MRGLSNKSILLTSGPTFAPLDGVRSITNHSTGRLGSLIAKALLQRNAKVWMLAGEASEIPFQPAANLAVHFHLSRFRTVPELKNLMRETLEENSIDAVIMAAAVLDYLPEQLQPGKKSSNDDVWTITLRRGEKLIEQIHRWSPSSFIVGFKLESNVTMEQLRAKAEELMDRSHAGLVVANRLEEISQQGHTAYIFERAKPHSPAAISNPILTKEAIAETLSQMIADRI